MKQSFATLEQNVKESLERLRQIDVRTISPAKAETHAAICSELRMFRKQLEDFKNAARRSQGRKDATQLIEQINRALSGSEYETIVDVSIARELELKKLLSGGPLNNSATRRIKKELHLIKTFRQKLKDADAPLRQTFPAGSTSLQRIKAYRAQVADAIRKCQLTGRTTPR